MIDEVASSRRRPKFAEPLDAGAVAAGELVVAIPAHVVINASVRVRQSSPKAFVPRWLGVAVRPLPGAPRWGHNDFMPVADLDDVGAVSRVPLREAKASFSELVARADLLDEVTVLTKHGRPAAAIVPAHVGADVAETRATVAALWVLLDRLCPPGQDAAVDDARAGHEAPQRSRRRRAGRGPGR
jgi:prevent-host-death family protein